MIKRLFAFVLCMVFMTAFIGCDKKKDDGPSKPKSESTVSNSAEKSSKTTDDKAKETKEQDSQKPSTDKGGSPDSSGIKVSMGQMGSNMKLPDNYPKDVVPVMEGGNIININDNRAAKVMAIIFTTNKSVDDVIKFYKDVMKDSKEFTNAESPTGTLISGNKSNRNIMVVISPIQVQNEVSVMINVADPQ